MNLNVRFITWLIPIVLELFKGNGRYPGYFKRNKTIVLLLIACLVCLALGLFMFEQAIMHGMNSKVHKGEAVVLTEKLEQCNQERQAMLAHCPAI